MMTSMGGALPLLVVENLCVALGPATVLDGCSFSLAPGARLALVGESGSGKTTLLKALLGLLPESAAVAGKVAWQTAATPAVDLLHLSERQWRPLRGRRIAWIPQEPSAALDPRMNAHGHLREIVRAHTAFSLASAGADVSLTRGAPALAIGLPKRAARREAPAPTSASGPRGAAALGPAPTLDGRVRELFDQVGLPFDRSRQYPHQWSGGMQQRLLVAMALAGRPALLLADEPTSALDPEHQSRLLDLLAALSDVALCLVTHDLAVAARASSQVIVLRHGRIVERGSVPQVFLQSQSDYTRALVAAQPSLQRAAAAAAS